MLHIGIHGPSVSGLVLDFDFFGPGTIGFGPWIPAFNTNEHHINVRLTYYKAKMVKIMSNPETNCTIPASVVVESSPDGAVVVSTAGSVP